MKLSPNHYLVNDDGTVHAIDVARKGEFLSVGALVILGGAHEFIELMGFTVQLDKDWLNDGPKLIVKAKLPIAP